MSSNHAEETPEQGYELLDFGEGRKLEQLGGLVIDRPSPAARDARKAAPELWNRSDFQYSRGVLGEWTPSDTPAETLDWQFCWRRTRLTLKRSGSGNVGFFPEQVSNWRWLSNLAAQKPRMKALNLFGYTGGSSLAIAQAGGQVTHVDASRPTIQWAKENCIASSGDDWSIRWIIEDAREFVDREVRRGNHYDAILLDPPTYGHSPTGHDWRIERDIDELLMKCLCILEEKPVLVLLTGHSPIASIETGPLQKATCDAIGARLPKRSRHSVTLSDRNGRRLDFGYALRWWG